MVLWGYKTVALFDVWSIEHFVTGMNMYFLARHWHRLYRQDAADANWFSLFGWIVAAAFGWEAIEHYLEIGLAGPRIADWFQGVEFWGNRLVTDPLMIMLGACVSRRYQWLNYPSKIFSVLWVTIHVFIFPDSMYLQRLDVSGWLGFWHG